MAKIRHLEQAPVIEVILGFQADPFRAWAVDTVRSSLGARSPGFPEI